MQTALFFDLRSKKIGLTADMMSGIETRLIRPVSIPAYRRTCLKDLQLSREIGYNVYV